MPDCEHKTGRPRGPGKGTADGATKSWRIFTQCRAVKTVWIGRPGPLESCKELHYAGLFAVAVILVLGSQPPDLAYDFYVLSVVFCCLNLVQTLTKCNKSRLWSVLNALRVPLLHIPNRRRRSHVAMGVILIAQARNQFRPQLLAPPLELRTPFQPLPFLFHSETVTLLVADSAILFYVLSNRVLRVIVRDPFLNEPRPHVLRVVLVIPNEKIMRRFYIAFYTIKETYACPSTVC